MYEKIIVGTDGATTAGRAVDRAAEIARAIGAHLTIMTAGDPKKAQVVVDQEAQRVSSTGPIDVGTLVVDADPSTALVEAAEAGGYDLLVVGNKGMHGVSRFFLGSVPNKVSHHVHCSLMIVKTT
jgi:nucleotide-binding universal stress UspA family protein